MAYVGGNGFLDLTNSEWSLNYSHGHLTVADHVNVSAASVVTRSIAKPGHYTGMFPIDDNAAWEKNAATLKQLHSLRERIRVLETTREQPEK